MLERFLHSKRIVFGIRPPRGLRFLAPLLGLLALLGCNPNSDHSANLNPKKQPANYQWQKNTPQSIELSDKRTGIQEIPAVPGADLNQAFKEISTEAFANPQASVSPPNHSGQQANFQVAQNDLPGQNPEPVSGPRPLLRIPLDPSPTNEAIQLSSARDRISLTARDAPLNMVLALIAEQHGLNVITKADINEHITVKLTDTPLEDALNVLLSVYDYTWTRQNNIIIVSKLAADNKTSPGMQGREVRVFTMNYVAATDVDKVVQGLLSPVGQSFINQTMPTDVRRTHEQLVVEDIPESIRRIEAYLIQADTPPRQVLIEAHVLQVTLKDNCRHGVNLKELLHIANADVTLATVGFANGLPPTSSVTIKGSELNGLLEAIKSTTQAKTLASPQVAVLNNQEAHMQVGEKIGYLLTTTTQTSTLQSVNFLDVGVILKVTPSITEDGQILIQVNPQVSTGRINATTQLPESETTEVTTRVLLSDGDAIVIGGLMKEVDNSSQAKVPFLGDLWLIGWFFQRSDITRERTEIIVTLLPRIIPNVPGQRSLDPYAVQRAQTPLLDGCMQPIDRSEYESEFPSYADPLNERPYYLLPSQPTVPATRMPIQSAPRPEEVPFAPDPRTSMGGTPPAVVEQTQILREQTARLIRLPPLHTR